MNRPIKFRAWNKYQSKMEFFDGYLPDLNDGEKEGNWEVMQFTGLHDKNGKEIYGGDIVRRENSVYTVSWNGFQGRWEGKNMVKMPSSFSIVAILKGGAEIIGNIYENPELLNDRAV